MALRGITGVDQRVFDENGIGQDCWKCCIATILGLTYEEVPELLGTSGLQQMRETDAFLSARGLKMRSGTINALGQIRTAYFIGSGRSPRSTEEHDFHHAVVCTLDEEGMVKIVFDPHPSRKGVSGDPDYFYWVEPIPQIGSMGCDVTAYEQGPLPHKDGCLRSGFTLTPVGKTDCVK